MHAGAAGEDRVVRHERMDQRIAVAAIQRSALWWLWCNG